MARMRSAAPRESSPAQRAEAAAVPCEARLGALDIRHGVAAESECILGTRFASCLSPGGRHIPEQQAGQQSEHRHHRESNASGVNILHLVKPLFLRSIEP